MSAHLKYIFYIFLFSCSLSIYAQPNQKLSIVNYPIEGAFFIADQNKATQILIDTQEEEVVRVAAKAFVNDINNISGILPGISEDTKLPAESNIIIAGTLGQNRLITELLKNKKISVSGVKNKWETYQISIVQNPFKHVKQALVITGSDKRGTAYGLFELSRMMGVNPYYWWADINPKKQKVIYVKPGNNIESGPSVKYRGIFLNDEDWGLQPWAAKNMDKNIRDIGPNTYERVFELLLRLKANYVWPAMHESTKAFWYYKDNAKVAQKYGIILGASHCEPMLRNNVFEWAKNYENEYGVLPAEWRYDLNPKQIFKYWDDRVLESKDNDAVYTVGMRGIHDGSMPGPGDTPGKINLLEKIIADQRTILSKNLAKPANHIPQIFCPYKEVLDLYQKGLNLPEDITIAWADDNYGYIRQLSNPQEQKRSGGSGVYYHLSYWGAPRDYLWLSSNSPSLISYEMSKAYTFGAGRLWVVNVGDIKPAEIETQFFMDLAWDINSYTPEKAHIYINDWATSVFGAEYASEIAAIKSEYYRLASAGKPEHINEIDFTREEEQKRILDYKKIAERSTQLMKKIPASLQDAYFELIHYPTLGAGLMNEKIFYARESFRLAKNKDPKLLECAKKSLDAYNLIHKLTHQYNKEIAGGKWDGMMSTHPRDQKVFEMPKVASSEMLKEPYEDVDLHEDTDNSQIISSSNFLVKHDVRNSLIKVLPGLGINNNGIAVLPAIVHSFTKNEIQQAPYVEYKTTLQNGQYTITVNCLPNFRIYEGMGLRYAISVNDDKPQIKSVRTIAETDLWEINVMRGYTFAETRHQISHAKESTIRIYLLDPGLVINTIKITAVN